jgi:RHS repeat-associated protein
MEEQTDFVIRTGAGNLPISRKFNSNSHTWPSLLEAPQWFGVAKPSSTPLSGEGHWFASLASYGFETRENIADPIIEVKIRDVSGDLLTFSVPQHLRWEFGEEGTAVLDGQRGTRLLRIPPSRYVLVKPGVGRYVYEQYFQNIPSQINYIRPLRLVSVYPPEGSTPICDLQYGAVKGRVVGLSCFGGQYVTVIWENDRVTRLQLSRPTDAAPAAPIEVVRYGYDGSAHLQSVEREPTSQGTAPATYYSYGDWGPAFGSQIRQFASWQGVAQGYPINITAVVEEHLDGPGRYKCGTTLPLTSPSYSFYNGTSESTGETSSVFSMPDDTNCNTTTGTSVSTKQTPSSELLTESYNIYKVGSLAGRTYAASISCTKGGAPCASMSSATSKWIPHDAPQWQGQSNPLRQVDRYYRDFRGTFTTTTARRVCTKTADCSGAPSPDTDGLVSVEILTRNSGAVDEFGGGALKTEAFTWQYSPQAFEKLPGTKSEPSVVQPGQSSVTKFTYDIGTRRLKATYRTGWTRDYRGNTFPRTVATFYFDYHKCGGGPADPQGRTLEVHGPCLVSSTNAVDCDQASETIPIKRMRYYDPLLAGPNAGRLQSTEAAVNATASNPSCSGVTWLRTGYGYDPQGNVIEETDPNGVVTYRTYSAGRLSQETVGGATTKYFYHPSQGGQLSAKRLPSGVWEKYCYRQSFGDTSCLAGILTPVLQWSARVDWSDPNNEPAAAPILEQTTFGYATGAGALFQSGGVVSYEDSQSFVSALERVVATYSYDALGRRVATRSVNPTTGAENFKSPSLFDESGNALGAGAPYNMPPELCGGQFADPATAPYKNAASSRCTRSQFDRMNRLSTVTSPTGVVTSFTYDAHGNVRTVAQSPGGTLATYEYDDFGNATAIQLQPSAPIRQEFDARGNVLVRFEQAFVVVQGQGQYAKRLAFAYDGLNRQLSASASDPSTGSLQPLVRYGYDEATAPWANCPPIGSSRTRGRVQWKEDSFGRSWYEYNELGLVTKARRVRAGTSACSSSLASASDATPDSYYEYQPDGRMAKMRYPHGRWLIYSYATGGKADQILRVDTALRADGADRVPVVTNIRYGLGGALLGYDTGSTPAASVSWIRGGSFDSTNPSCSALDSSLPSSSDGTGRPWGLWVTRQGTPLFRRQYGWTADQLTREGTCLLDSASIAWQSYGYDPDLQLTVHSTPNASGASYTYTNGSDRLRLDEESQDSWLYEYDAERRLKSVSLAPEDGASWSRRDFGYSPYNVINPNGSLGASGTTSEMAWSKEAPLPPLSNGSAQNGRSVLFQTHRGLWGVYNSVSVNGAVYQYVYDAVGRRRLKVYPTGTTDEFFYDQDQLIEDRGRRSPVQTAPPDPLTGTWQSGSLSVNLTLTGSALNGTLDTQGYTHALTGTFNATTQRSTLQILRTNRQDGCMTVMYGEIRMLSQTQLGVDIFGTDGACDLGDDFSEYNVYTRMSGPPQPSPGAKLAGAWLRSSDNLNISLAVSGDRVTGRLDTPDFRHTLSGRVSGATQASSLTVTRVNMHSGCATNMYGTMSASDTQLQVSITGTDGLCDLPTWFSENSTYRRTEAAGEYVLHEYIWLGGTPVAVVKTALDASYNRMTAKNCWRNDEYDACGTVYPVSDYLPKVVAVVDSAGRLAGAADYDAFGRVNEVSKRADVPAPRPGPVTAAYPTGRYAFGAYTPNQNVDLAVLSQPWGSSRQRVQMRVNYAQVNTPGGMASSTDKTWVTLGSGAQVAPTPTPEDRWYAGRLYATSTNWFEAPANGDVRVKWASGPTQQPQEYTGATVRSYEYRRFELGAQPTWVALRFPGQYADAETGLFENWNRFYDPSTGRYTATDPMTPAANGSGLAPFAYASNNPLSLSDRSGLAPDSLVKAWEAIIQMTIAAPGDTFETKEAAAMDMLGYMKEKTDASGLEHAGVVYEKGKSFSYDEPVSGSLGSVTPVFPVEKRSVLMAHTHPYALGYDGEVFKDQDVIFSEDINLPSYLLTPSGQVFVYTPLGKGVSFFGRVTMTFFGTEPLGHLARLDVRFPPDPRLPASQRLP